MPNDSQHLANDEQLQQYKVNRRNTIGKKKISSRITPIVNKSLDPVPAAILFKHC